jgi:peptide/nickel transport system substrate-binding protein
LPGLNKVYIKGSLKDSVVKNLRNFTLLLVVILLVLIIMPSSSVVAQEEKTVKYAYAADINTLNPFYWTTVADLDLLRIIYDTPFRIGPDGMLHPGLVESYEFKNSTYIVFRLVRNATWHDGVPVTADDLKFTLEFVRDHTLPYLGSVGEALNIIEKIDNYTVGVKLKYPFSPLPLVMADIFLVTPKHIWEKITNPQQFANPNPVGSGPFKFVERKTGEYILLEKNTKYFKGAPKVDKLLLKIIPSLDSQVLALKSGELDMIEIQPGPIVRDLMSTPNVSVMTAPSTYIYYVDFNLRRYPMNIRDFRKAIAYAIDKQQILNILLLGMGRVADSLIVPSLPLWYNPNVTKYNYDPKKAKEILDNLGFKDIDNDGFREFPNGTKFVLNMPTANVDIWPRLTELVANMLEAIGLKVKITPVEPGTLIDILLNKWDFDINVFGWRLYFDPDAYIYESFHSSRIRKGGLNWSGYSNSTVDKLLDDQRKAVNIEERKQLLFRVQELLADDLPWIPLVYPDMIFAVRTDTFKGWVAIPRYGLRNVYSWINLRPAIEVITTPVYITPSPILTQTTTQIATATPVSGIPLEIMASIIIIVIAVAIIVLIMRRR